MVCPFLLPEPMMYPLCTHIQIYQWYLVCAYAPIHGYVCLWTCWYTSAYFYSSIHRHIQVGTAYIRHKCAYMHLKAVLAKPYLPFLLSAVLHSHSWFSCTNKETHSCSFLLVLPHSALIVWVNPVLLSFYYLPVFAINCRVAFSKFFLLAIKWLHLQGISLLFVASV